MNLVLLEPSEVDSQGLARLSGRRLTHVREVLRSREGDTLRVGVLGGKLGLARVVGLTHSELVLQTELAESPPARANVDLLLAIPRPKALKKVIPAIASLGIDRVVLLNAARVEKSYFGSKVLDVPALDGLVRLGLEQGRDTIAPQLLIRDRFRPFIEDELPGWLADGPRFTPHPTAPDTLPRRAPGQRVTLAVGPEGGWVPFEIDLLRSHGFIPVSVGARPLRVEVALPVIIGALG